METTLTTSSNRGEWEIIPTNTVAGVILAVFFIYLFFRHMMFVLMFMDIVIGWLRKFRWFPKEGKRLKTLAHWAIALGLFLGYLFVAGNLGYLEFVPRK